MSEDIELLIDGKKPEELSEEERVEYIQTVRRRVTQKEDVSDEELRTALLCIRIQQKGGKAAKSTAKKPATPSLTLDDI